MNKFILISLFALALSACSSNAPVPVPTEQTPIVKQTPVAGGKTCMGDLDGNGTVSIDEATQVTMVKTGASNVDVAAVLKAADANGNGVIDDKEFYQVIQNQATGTCTFTK